MRRTLLTVTVTFVLVSGLYSLAPAREGRVMAAPIWEYRVLTLTDFVTLHEAIKEPAKMVTAFESKFNELGRDGWEFADNSNGMVIFKRQKP